MVNHVIRCLVVALVLWIVYIIAGLIVAAVHGPVIALTIVAVILLLVLVAFILREFGVDV